MHGSCYSLEEAAAVDVREVQHDAQSIRLVDEVPAEVGEALGVIATAAVGGEAGLVGGEMQEAKVADPALGEVPQPIQTTVEGVSPFDPTEPCHSPRGADRA